MSGWVGGWGDQRAGGKRRKCRRPTDTLSRRYTDGPWSMQSSQFTIQGFTRTYWDFFLGAGFTVGVLYVFAAVLAWQLGGLPVATLASMRGATWSFAACFVAVMALSLRYLFWIPIVMSG